MRAHNCRAVAMCVVPNGGTNSAFGSFGAGQSVRPGAKLVTVMTCCRNRAAQYAMTYGKDDRLDLLAEGLLRTHLGPANAGRIQRWRR